MITLGFIISLNWLCSDDLEDLRAQYIAAAVEKDRIQLLSETCDEVNPKDPTFSGYCTMIHFIAAKKAINPYNKLAEFKNGQRELDSLILNNEHNIELRYMRHSIQERVPSFLGYNKKLQEDEKFMRTNLNSVSDSSTYQLIYNYLKHRN